MIPNEAEFLDALRKVTAAFEKLEIEYAVGGSYASSMYGEARATRDVDLIAAVTGRHAGPLVRAHLRGDRVAALPPADRPHLHTPRLVLGPARAFRPPRLHPTSSRRQRHSEREA